MAMVDEFFDTSKVSENCAYIRKYCNNNKHLNNYDLLKKCDQLIESLKFIDEKAKSARFEDIPINGYVPFIKIVNSFTEQIVNQIKNKNKVKQNLIKIFDVIFTYRDWVFDIHQSLDEQNTNDLLMKSKNVSKRSFYNALNIEDSVFSLVFSSYVAWWLPKEIKKLLHFFCFVIAFTCRMPFSFAALWSNEAIGRYCVQAYKNVNLDYCFDCWHRAEGFFPSKVLVPFLNRKVHVKSKTLQVSRQTRFRLDYKGNILDLDNMSKEEIDAYLNDKVEQSRQHAPGKRWRNKETIQCRYSCITDKQKVIESLQRIRNKKNVRSNLKILKYYSASRAPSDFTISDAKNRTAFEMRRGENFEINISEEDTLLDKNLEVNPEKAILLYIHGGGFCAMGSTSSEIFLQKICKNLGGIPILSVDYSLTVPFPVPNQEILDVYLWLLSGEKEVFDMLKFYPEKVVVAGDSAGGFLTLSLTIVLNELNKMLNRSNRKASPSTSEQKQHFPLPKSIVAAYPVISLPGMTPSKAMLAVEPLVELHMYSVIYSMYGANLSSIGDMKKIENTELFKQIAFRNEKLFIDSNDEYKYDNVKKKKSSDSSPWFAVDYRTYRNYSDYIGSFYNNSFINPASYDKFDELKSVSLFTFIGCNDFLLDDCIELARKWKGKVQLDVFEDCIHAFLQLSPFSERFDEATEVVIGRFQEAFGLL